MNTADAVDTQVGHYTEVGDLNMYYVASGSGRPLVLVHGGSVANSMWDPIVPLLEPHFHVIRPDSRAHGRTNNPRGNSPIPRWRTILLPCAGH